MQEFLFKGIIQQLRGKITKEECQKAPPMASSLRSSLLFKEKKAVNSVCLKICKKYLQMDYSDFSITLFSQGKRLLLK